MKFPRLVRIPGKFPSIRVFFLVMRPTEYVQGTQEKYYKYKTSIDQKERVIIYLVNSSTDVSFIMVLYARTFFFSQIN